MHRSLIGLVLLLPAVAAAIPVSVDHQGRLLDPSGTPIHGEHTVTVRLHDAPTGGAVLFTQAFDLAVADGYYAVRLDTDDTSGQPLDSSLFSSAPPYVSVQVDGASLGARKRLATVPFAAEAEVARGIAVSNATGACTDGELRWNPSSESLQVCDGGDWVLTGGTAGLSQGVYENATVTVDADGRISSISAGSSGGTTLQTRVQTATTLNSWRTVSCPGGYTLTGCACRYVSDSTNFWPGWCEASSTTACRGRGYYGSPWTFQVQAICVRLQ